MNVTLPDDASIQIIVVPQGMTPMSTPFPQTAPVLSAGSKSSRRRDAVFLTFGACMCAAVLAVVRTQPTSPRMIDPAHAAVSANRPMPPPVPPTVVERIPEAPHLASVPPDADAADAIRRLLREPPTLTPPPGAPAPVASAPNTAGTPASRNAFGMTD